jgi:hypothetical protein
MSSPISHLSAIIHSMSSVAILTGQTVTVTIHKKG